MEKARETEEREEKRRWGDPMKERNREGNKDRGQEEVRGKTKISDRAKDRKTKKQRQKEVAWETGSKEAETDRHQALYLGSPSFLPFPSSFLYPC